MTTTAVIYAHPYEKSYNRAILDAVTEKLERDKRAYELIDLYADGFNPVMSKEELALYIDGKASCPLVKKYNEILDRTDKIILIFPIWWYDFPAILKGFFDKVMLPISSYEMDGVKLIPVRDIKETLVITTSSAPTKDLIKDFGDAVNKVMIDSTFKAIGLNGAVWHNLGNIAFTTLDERKEFLELAAKLA